MADGKVIIETGLDMTGATKDLNNLGKTIDNKGQKATQRLNKETISLEKNLKKTGITGAESMQQISSGADKSSKSVSGLKASLGKIAGILAAGFSIRALINMGKQAVDIASNMNEVQNVVNTAFDSMSYKMEDFAQNSIENLGISKLSAKKIGSTYAAMARGMGQNLDMATDYALKMTSRVADIASFYNLTLDEVNTIGRAVYSGETEPLKRIGVVMTESQLETFALANGYSTLYKNMSAADKLFIRQQYFLNQTNLAAGDFIRTQDSWANQTRILSERWKEFLSLIGNALIKVLAPAIKAVNMLLQQMIDALNKIADKFGFAFETTADKGIADITDAMDNYTDSVQSAEKAQKSLLGSYDKLSVITSNISSNSTNTSTSTNIGSPDITPTIDKNKVNKTSNILNEIKKKFETFTKDIEELSKSFAKVFDENVIPMFESFGNDAGIIFNNVSRLLGQIFSDMWSDFIYPNLQNLITYGIPLFTDFATQVSNTTAHLNTVVTQAFGTMWDEAIAPFLRSITGKIEEVWVIISQFWDKYGEPIFSKINDAINNTKSTFDTAWNNYIKPMLDIIGENLDDLWNDHLNPLIKEIGEFVGTLATCALDIYNEFISPVVQWLINTLGPVFQKVFKNILSRTSIAFGLIIDYAKNFLKTFEGIAEFLTGVFTLDWERAWRGIKKVFSAVWGNIQGAFKAVVNVMIGFVNKLLGAFEAGVNFVIKGLNKLSFDVPDWVPFIGGEHFGIELDNLKVSKIPYLATGAVLPANNPFMAVVGDQKHGTNIEAPLDTIVQAFKEANKDSNQAGDIYLKIDGDVLFKWIRKKTNDYQERYGLPNY